MGTILMRKCFMPSSSLMMLADVGEMKALEAAAEELGSGLADMAASEPDWGVGVEEITVG